MCGVVGFRPSTGGLPLAGIVAPAWTLDSYGLFARDVRTISRVVDELELMTRTEAGRRPLILGAVADESLGEVQPEVEGVYRAALNRWESSGVELRTISLPEFELAAPAAALIAYVEVAAQHERWIRRAWECYGTEARQLICLGNLFSGTDYALAQRARLVMQRRFARFTAEVDAIVTPTLPITPPRLGGKPSISDKDGQPLLFEIIRFTALANMIGAPAISIPIGLTSAGLPVGIQVAARPWDDALVLRAAADLEASAQFVAKPSCFIEIEGGAGKSDL
jgi:aspartyl-tRNA(Asn)/glutamyl-tRNA(Gln) amidotransferase subunit A